MGIIRVVNIRCHKGARMDNVQKEDTHSER